MVLSEVLAAQTVVAGTPMRVRSGAEEAGRNGAQAREPGADFAAYQRAIQVLEELLVVDKVSVDGAEAAISTTKAGT